ncbi:MAG: DegT/DnrJ/EryC1/StrS family aminotransferase [Clostridium butyricum]|nr:DegT/DnrJ/EryC1/StrS family aminotransferase [Clostridium butyricum]
MRKFENKIQVTKAFLPPMNEYINEIKSIWEDNWLTNNGKIHDKLQRELQKYLKVKKIALFTNGHSAMEIAIKSLDLKGEVITTPFTFASTTHAIVNNNLTPRFCDIKMDDYTIDENKIEALINEKTCAIIPVHVFGCPCNTEKIENIAKKYNLKVIYDAAHVFGVEVNGRGIGSFGDISMCSMHATKVYNTIEGGLLATSQLNLNKKFEMIKNFGIVDEEHVESIGVNAKMNEFQAAMGIVNLRYVDNEMDNRRKITNEYRNGLGEIKGIKLLKEKKNIKYNYAYFPILIEESITKITRNELYEELKKYNIYTRKYFYPLTTEFDCYKGEFDDSNIPNAKYVADRILTLPLYGSLKIEETRFIINAIREILKRK